jgi:hypothetical protein
LIGIKIQGLTRARPPSIRKVTPLVYAPPSDANHTTAELNSSSLNIQFQNDVS